MSRMSTPHINDPALLEAFKAKRGHTPRTQRWGAEGLPAFTNALILSSSLHLEQHAHTPIDWREWGEEALAEARALDRPIFVCVGYSACHWCHLMARETFEDDEVAALLNAEFVSIKVDRERRPEVDSALMDFVQITSGKGGWPLNAFLTPEGTPLFATTYLPPRDGQRGVEVGLLSYLRVLSRSWRDPRLQAQAAPPLEALRAYAAQLPSASLSPAWLDAAAERWLSSFDPDWGGFSAAPKFPRPAVLEALMRAWHSSGDARLLKAVEVTLERMCCGGLYDHLWGGFFRYSLDNRWWAPRFERLLIDNAQLAVVYLEAHQATRRPLYAEVARQTLRALVALLRAPEGGLCASRSAYSLTPSGEQAEGYFDTWTPRELREALTEEQAAWVEEVFGVSGEGRCALRLHEPLSEEEQAYWRPLQTRLRRAQAQRPRPEVDDAVLCAWHAAGLKALARGAAVLGEPEWLDHAEAAGDFALKSLWDGARLARAWRRGAASGAGTLEDHMALSEGLLALFEVTGSARYLSAARAIYAAAEGLFDGERGGFFRCDERARALLFVEERPMIDGGEPSGNALAAEVALSLHQLTGEPSYRAQASATLRALGALMATQPTAAPKGLCALARWLGARGQVVVAQLPDGERPVAHALSQTLWATFSPYVTRLTLSAVSEEARAQVPALKRQPDHAAAPRAAVCEAGGEVRETLSSTQGLRAALVGLG
ncbi:MAG: thioredoxin domain-containing protein [Deltaproteobacteria bacterium]|nr:thioredoxin domain-containing protein [Deltaproteobacteria bacterium]